MKLILASASPRRKQLLAKIVSNFDVIPSLAPEIGSAKIPSELVVQLAQHKAFDVWQSHPDALVIGCDTIVDLDGEILGKPKDFSRATAMLQSLSDRSHFVHTGVCVLVSENIATCDILSKNSDFCADNNGYFERQTPSFRSSKGDVGIEWVKECVPDGVLTKATFCETSEVTFRKLSAKEIADYVASGAPMDKAGAYGIQECDFAENVRGSLDNVIGLPTERLAMVLREIGF